jgi:MoaA/NifB/PqqE/SkfB family radical SAM enzyme
MFTLNTYSSILRALVTKKSPYYVQFYINGKCNLKCRQCNIVETNSRIPEMSLEEIEVTAWNLKKIGGAIVLLTGGEPFLRKDLPQIVEIFTKKKLNVRLQTAGTHFATEEMLRACYEAGARDINVSLDSLDFGTSDYINAVPGSGRNAIETIERISNIFRQDSAILSFGTVLSQFNYFEIPSILEFAKNIGWFVSLVPVHIASQESPMGFRSYDNLFKFRKNQYSYLDDLGDELIKLKKSGSPLFDSQKFIESGISFLKGNAPTWRKNSVCDSPNLYFAIRPNGDFSTCCDYTLRQPPSLKDPSFSKSYNRGDIQKRLDVNSIVKNCSGCHYGSYPEVTLSVRDPKAFMERSFMLMKFGSNKLKTAQVKSGFVEEIERIKLNYPNIYPVQKWMATENYERIKMWESAEGRKDILIEDHQARKKQNRLRGKGEDYFHF